MNEVFEREDFYSFAVYEPETGNELNMLQANEIKHILPHELRYLNGIPRLYYHVEGRQPVRLVYDKTKLGYGELTMLMDGVCKVIDITGRYLLSCGDLLLDEDHIYYNWGKDMLEFLYLPGYGRPVMEQLTTLVEYMLKNVNYQDVSAANLIYSLYEDVQKRGVSLELFRIYCDGEFCHTPLFGPRLTENNSDENGMQESEAPRQAQCSETDLYIKENILRQTMRMFKDRWKNRHVTKKKQPENIPVLPRSSMAAAEEEKAVCNEGRLPETFIHREQDSATTLLTEQRETICLKAVNGDYPMLVPKEKIIIGRQENACDYVLEQKEVSRIHASVTCNQEQVIVTDLNSSNGTYVNQNKLGIYESVVLGKGDEVRFGSVTFLVVVNHNLC